MTEIDPRWLPLGLGFLVAGSALSPSVALANGRFPASNQVASTVANPALVLVRTTFGLLVSRDGGQSFDWICESAAGYGGEQDPGVAVMADGSLVVAAFEGLSVSHDGGCTWELEGALANEFVIDVAASAVSPSAAVALTSTGLGIGKFHVQAFRTVDDAKTWLPTGPALDQDILAETIDVAPSDPMRLYVSGESGSGADRKGVLATSQDGGVTWVRTDVELGGDQQLFIAGVDPKDANRVYLRTVGEVDRLIVTKDGGKTFASPATVTRPLSGFAVSPDGLTVLLGGPQAGWTPGSKPADSVERRPALLAGKRDDLVFVETAKLSSSCLGWVNGHMFACGDGFTDGFVIGRSQSGSPPFDPLLAKLSDIRGPLSCPASTPTAQKCTPLWPALRASFVGTNAGAGGAGGAPAAGAPGQAGASAGCATNGTLGLPSTLLALAGLFGFAALVARGRR